MRFRCPLKQAVPSHEILWLLSDSVRKEQCNSRPLTSLVCTAQRHALCVYTFVNKVWRSLSPVPLTKSFRHWAVRRQAFGLVALTRHFCYRAGVVASLKMLPKVKVPRRSENERSEEHTSELQSLRHLVCRL